MFPVPSDDELTGMAAMFRYDSDTGHISAFSGKAAGRIVGSPNKRGYLRLQYKGRTIACHRLAWFLYTGEWPDRNIDHRNRIRTDNRFANLRLASFPQNTANSRINTRNTSGFKGVSWNTQAQKWLACIVVGGRKTHLGIFLDPGKGAAAYRTAAHKIYGEYVGELG